MAKNDTLLLIDSFALIHRAYHAFPPSLTTIDGQQVNAAYGFAKLVIEVILKFKPKYVAAAFDGPEATVRHQQYGAYKGHRSAPDAELISQIPMIEQWLAAMQIPVLKVPGYEADDMIGTIDARRDQLNADTIIVTGDRDLFQLVDENTFVYMAGSQFAASKLYDASAVTERMGVPPERIIDYKALLGDASDNIPGVKGIGEKGAIALIQKFGTLEEIYSRIAEVEPKYQKKLVENHEMAVLSKQLATIICDVPYSFDIQTTKYLGPSPLESKMLFDRLQFRSLNMKLQEMITLYGHSQQDGVSESGAQTSFISESKLAKLANWTQQPFADSNVYLYAEPTKESNQFNIDVTKLLVGDSNQQWSLLPEQTAALVNTLADKNIITNDGKLVINLLLNSDIHARSVYDVSVSGFIISMGRDKDWPGLVHSGGAADLDEISALRQIHAQQIAEIAAQNLSQQLFDTEQELIAVVAKMERAGIKLDVALLAAAHDKLAEALELLEQEIYADAGHEFNIGSPKQVGEILFEEKRLPSGGRTKTGAYVTDERTLMNLVNIDPIVDKILKFRELTKLMNTYVAALPSYVNEQTGRVHGTFNQNGAVTGRFSSQNPNLQNIPVGEVAGVNLRDAFVAEPGAMLVSFDYSQQELRILAELSGDEKMQEAFIDGEDIHAVTASQIFEKPLSEVTAQERRIGKTINFGIVYGMSGFGLADRLKIDEKVANDFIKTYFAKYSAVQAYYKTLLDEAKSKGYVENMLGRRRSAMDLNAPNFHLRRAVEREIMNFPLQSSAADIIKKAMCGVDAFLDNHPVKLILQIHDELLFEYQTDLEPDALKSDKQFLDFAHKVRETMLSVIQLRVPFETETKIGKNWGKMDKVKI